MAGDKFISVESSLWDQTGEIAPVTMKIWDFNGTCYGTIEHDPMDSSDIIKVVNDKIIVACEQKKVVNDQMNPKYTSDTVVHIYNLNNGLLEKTLVGHTEPIRQIETVDNKIITQSYDRTIKIWDFDGVCHHTLKSCPWVQFYGYFIINGDTIITTLGNKVLAYNMNNGQLLYTLDHDKPVYALAVANNKIFTSLKYSDSIKVWDLMNGSHLWDLVWPRHYCSAFKIVGNKLFTNSPTNAFRIWTDLRDHKKQESMLALATATHGRCGQRSPANCLIPYLLQEISKHVDDPWTAGRSQPIIQEIQI